MLFASMIFGGLIFWSGTRKWDRNYVSNYIYKGSVHGMADLKTHHDLWQIDLVVPDVRFGKQWRLHVQGGVAELVHD